MNQNLPSSSLRIQELKAEISAIANVPKANSETAAKAVTLLLACYPNQQNPDERVAKAFVQQLINLCTGVDLDVLQAMIEVNSGSSLVRQKPSFLPNAGEVAEWIDWKMEPKRSRIGWYLDEIKAIEDRHEEAKVTPEERMRRVDMLIKVSQVIRETSKVTQRASPPLKAWQATEIEAAPLRIEALRNLDAMRGIAQDDAPPEREE